MNSNKYQYKRSIKKATGMTFIEVLVAVVILVTGILGAIALQAVAKKSSFDTMQRSLASSLAQDIVERIRGNNANNINLYGDGSPFGAGNVPEPAVDCSQFAVNCTSTQIVAYDLFEWEQSLIGSNTTNGESNVGGLVNGVGCITVNGNAVTVVISWQGRTDVSDGATSARGDAACGVAGNKRRQVVVNAFII